MTKTYTQLQMAKLPSTLDLPAVVFSLCVLGVGAGIVACLVDPKQASAPVTGLLILALLAYAIASGRLAEFSGPGGWKAKFSEAVDKPVDEAAGVIQSRSLEMNLLAKAEIPADLPGMFREIAGSRGDKRPLVLTLTMGGQHDPVVFANVLIFLSTLPNFRGVVVLDGNGRLVAYSSARQIVWIAISQCDTLRAELLKNIHDGKEGAIKDDLAMSTATVPLGSTFADALQLMLREHLTCVAVTDSDGKLSGLIDRDRLMGSLVLSLARIAQGKPLSSLLARSDKPAGPEGQMI